jgi:hypothetical protein
VKLLLAEQRERIDLQFRLINMMAEMVRTRHQIAQEQKKSLRDAIEKVLTGVGVPLWIGVGNRMASN